MAVPAGFDFGRSLNQGVAAGRNIQDAWNDRADRKLETGSRQAQADAAGAASGIPAQNEQAHATFLTNLATGLKHVAQGVEGFFNPAGAQGAAAPSIGGALPGPAVPPQGVLPAMPAGTPAPGGVPYNPAVAQAAPVPQPGAPMQMQRGGAVPYPMATGGVVPAEQQANQAAADAVPTPVAQTLGAAMPPPATAQHNPPGFGNFQVSRTHRDEVDDFATHLHEHSLNDSGMPHKNQGIAMNPGDVLAQVAKNPAAAQGIPEASPAASQTGKATKHSLSPQFWDDSDMRISKAVKAAALAGHDPNQVMQSLNSVRTSFIQGHVLRNLSSANVALMNGDNTAVEKALRNVNYYLPDGEDLNIRKDGGQLMYQNPMQPYLDANGQPTETKTAQENFIPVDAAHIQMLGTAMLDPMKVNDIITSARAAGAKRQLDMAKAGAAITTANAAATTAGAADMKARTDRSKAASAIYKDTSQGALNEAHARYYDDSIDLSIKKASAAGDKLAYTAGNDAAKAVYNLAQGTPTTVPVTDSEGNPSLSPAAGKSMRDPGKIPPEFQLKPEQLHNVAALAGEIGAANRGRIPAEQAAQIAAQVYGGVKKTHPGPDGKPQGNVKISADRAQGWYWNGAGWTPFKLSPDTGGVLATGRTDIIPPPSDDEEGSDSSGDEEPSADDEAPAE